MMKLVKIKGVVVGEQVYSESSKILKIFTKEYGIISVMSKGCRKIKSIFHEASNTLVYANFDISYKEEGISNLVAVDIIKIFKNIVMDCRDLEKKAYSFLLINIVTQIINQKNVKNIEIANIYDIFLASINKIDEGFTPKIIVDIAMLKYLEYLGVKPSVDCCSNCGSSSNIITISSSSFGYVCSNCYRNEKIVSKDTIKMIRMLYYVDIDRIKKLEIKEDIIKEIDEFLEDYYEEHTGIYGINKKNSFLKIKDVFA